MKIRPEIEIYPDPEYCEKTGTQCIYWNMNKYTEKVSCDLYLVPLEKCGYKGFEIKCAQCKADWLKAKLREPVDFIMIDGHRFECLKRPVYGDCGKIMASLVCDDDEKFIFLEKCRKQKDISISTHGIFNHVGIVFATGMFPAGDKMHIEITVVINEWMVENG